MRQERQRQSDSADKTVRDIRRATRRRFSAEDKIRIVLEGLRGEVKAGISAALGRRFPAGSRFGEADIRHTKRR